jgi:hypothetical protein
MSQRQPSEGIVNCLTLVHVEFYDNDDKPGSGDLVINKDLRDDVISIFKLIKELHFPITSVIPVNRFGWEDERSMEFGETGNTSAYNFRAGSSGGYSYHETGRAIDINPKCNPFIESHDGVRIVKPAGAVFDPHKACALSFENPEGKKIIEKFSSFGWTWGGSWANTKDYQHFQKSGKASGIDPKDPAYCHSN